MVTFTVKSVEEKLENMNFNDMYELLSFVSSYVHKKTEKEIKLHTQLQKIKEEPGYGPFNFEEAKLFLVS